MASGTSLSDQGFVDDRGRFAEMSSRKNWGPAAVALEPSIGSGGAAARYNDNPNAQVWLEKSVTIQPA